MRRILMVLILAVCGCSDGGAGTAGVGAQVPSARCSTSFYDESIEVGLTPPDMAIGPFYEFRPSGLSVITWFRANDVDLDAPWIVISTRHAILSLEDDAAFQAIFEDWIITVNEPFTLLNGEPAWVISAVAPGTSLGLMLVKVITIPGSDTHTVTMFGSRPTGDLNFDYLLSVCETICSN